MKSSKLFITCEEASLFSVRKEDENLSFGERFKLLMHLAICKFCRLFYRQQKFLSIQIMHLSARISLSDSEKDKMHALIQSIADKN